MHNGIKLLSGKSPTTNAYLVTSDRYQFLDLGSAEPNLGVPDDPSTGNSQYVLLFDTDPLTGFRRWANVSNLLPPPLTVDIKTIIYTANEGDTVFVTPHYIPSSNQVNLYIDGVKQYPTEFVETSPTEITLTSPASQDDIILIEVISTGTGGSQTSSGANNIIILNNTISPNIFYPSLLSNTSGNLEVIYLSLIHI